ncbi:hypothetical protein I302_106569 [Kwoniella bestiolae CBS 10118]|uniref:Uncharacterized protein n=1 Tax=Kwoniella bestiolae CBS 10118 TaxID=1296100 RepID=A0A1B9G122_9TREE|nr:hypothetical protein I302_06169 [Kwoniella bestiolae CBS 10118]OCF24708.1 hypothetical protein I302_06169 [Kwoniella bestiolae CBS 10118]
MEQMHSHLWSTRGRKSGRRSRQSSSQQSTVLSPLKTSENPADLNEARDSCMSGDHATHDGIHVVSTRSDTDTIVSPYLSDWIVISQDPVDPQGAWDFCMSSVHPTVISQNPADLDVALDIRMSSRNATPERILEVFTKRGTGTSAEDGDHIYGLLDTDSIIAKYHNDSMTVEARKASIAAMFKAAMTNSNYTKERIDDARLASSRWHDPEYRGKKYDAALNFDLDEEDDEAALKVLKWHYD